MPRLVVMSKGAPASTHELGDGWTTIGRADGNRFQLMEPSISGRHCEVRYQTGELLVRDLQSTNGTFIDGRPVTEGALKPGATLRLGDVEIHFEDTPAPVSHGTSFVTRMLMQSAAAARAMAPTADASKTGAPGPATPGSPGRTFQVLFVDDSMAFLELFGDLCFEFSNRTWNIHKATSADAALHILRDVVTDLVLLDIGMPMLDGLQLLGIINKRFPGLKIAVMTGNATEAKRADALAKGAELFLEKPVSADGMRSVFNMLQDLVSWHREGFTGALRQVNLQEVIQMECNGRHSSVLEIGNHQLRGQIYIEAGAITHAAVADLSGRPAFYRLLSMRGGDFHLAPFTPPAQRTINTAWEYLLMDAALAIDEESLAIKMGVPPGPPPTPIGQEPQPEPHSNHQTAHVAVGENLMMLTREEAGRDPVDSSRK